MARGGSAHAEEAGLAVLSRKGRGRTTTTTVVAAVEVVLGARMAMWEVRQRPKLRGVATLRATVTTIMKMTTATAMKILKERTIMPITSGGGNINVPLIIHPSG
jgi:hypothetical protein